MESIEANKPKKEYGVRDLLRLIDFELYNSYERGVKNGSVVKELSKLQNFIRKEIDKIKKAEDYNPNNQSPKNQHIEIGNLLRHRLNMNDFKIIEILEHNQYILRITIEVDYE